MVIAFLLWRVETLQSLTPDPSPSGEGSEYAQDDVSLEEQSTSLATWSTFSDAFKRKMGLSVRSWMKAARPEGKAQHEALGEP